MSRARRGDTWRAAQALALAAGLWLAHAAPAAAAPAAPSAEADAALIEACLGEPAMLGRDRRECGERLATQCLAEAGGASQQATALACEKRRAEAWGFLARKAYREIEAKLGEADKRLLRTSQVQFELEQRDLCAATRLLAGADPELAAASCAADLLAARALILARLAAGRGATAR